MKTFTTAAAEAVRANAEERQARIQALIDAGKTKDEAEAEVVKKREDDEEYVEFELDGRKIKAYTPNPGQMTFLLAAMGRGQTKESRFSSVLNVMFESLDEDGQAYIENRLLSRKPETMMEPKELEGIFEFLVEEWFADPSQESSDSAR